ncbi:branched-chain amino acid ABC transporter ATP-binding protein/permease [Promicromonospora soli]
MTHLRRGSMVAFLVLLPLLSLLLGNYQGGLLAQFSMYGVATAALTVSWGLTGILNLGHAVSFGVGAYVSAWIGANTGPEGVVPGLIAGAAAAGLLALLVGAIGLRGRVNAITFALLTFVVLFGAIQVAHQWTPVTGGFNGLAAPGLSLGDLWEADRVSQRVIVVALAAVLVLGLLAAARSPFGAMLTLIRDNPVRAASLGYAVPRVRIAVFSATGAVTGLAGGLFATQTHFVSPDEIGLALATNFVIWAMIGSRTSIVGGFVAAITMSYVSNELSDALQSLWLLVVGVIFLAVVLFLPDGIASALDRALPRLARPHHVDLSAGALPTPSAARAGKTLTLSGITCTFGSFAAVDGVSASFDPGGVHCLIGPNGAGKSTLLNAVSGTVLPSSGRWALGGADLSMQPPWRQARGGISRKFQAPSIAPGLTVAQNLALAVWATRVPTLLLLVTPWRCRVPDVAQRVLEVGGLAQRKEALAGDLSHGQRQMLELAMTFATGPGAVLLDEPTAGMTKNESTSVSLLLRDEARTLGIPIVVVEHDMSLIRTAASSVTVLQAGRLLAHGTVEEIERDERVQAAYLGGSHR